MLLPIHHIAFSEANGPGKRIVIWVQGCKLNCAHCFNPNTHSFSSGTTMDTDRIANDINQNMDLEGVTFSGGEPLEYPESILDIISKIRPELNIIVFSGYTIDEVAQSSEKMNVILKADLSILGRYNDNLPHPYFGKKFVLTSQRIDMQYFKQLYKIEYTIDNNTVTKTGIFKRII